MFRSARRNMTVHKEIFQKEKEIMKRKVLAVMMTAVMAIGMTGCGNGEAGAASGENTKESVAAAASGEEKQAESTSEETVEPIDVSLTVWSPSEDQDPEVGAWLVTMCDRFNEQHPEWNITFEYGVCTESSAKKEVPKDMEAAADVFIYGSTGIENLCSENCLTELGGKYLDEVKANSPASLVECLTYEGGVYGVPITTDTYFMYYDKSVFTEEDVTSLEKMLEKGKVACPITNGYYLACFYLANGCSFFTDADGNFSREAGIDLSGDKAVAVTDYLVDLAANENFVNAEPADAIAMMREGSVNAYFCGSWQAAQTEEILGDNYGVAVVPAISLDGKETQLRPFTSAKAVGVKSTTKYPEVALNLALYLGSYEAQKAHYEMRGYVPCNTTLTAELSDSIICKVDSETAGKIAVARAAFTEMSYYWTPAESFGTEIRDGVVTHENAVEKTAAFHAAANTSGVE